MGIKSYGKIIMSIPNFISSNVKMDVNSANYCFPIFTAVRTGLEPVTPCVTGMYSNQLN